MNKMDTSEKLRTDMNHELSEYDAPIITDKNNEYDKAKNYTEFNLWLKSTHYENLELLAEHYGLLPIVYSLSGIDVLNVTLLQNRSSIDLLGHVRYLNIVLDLYTKDETIMIGNELFNNQFSKELTEHELRSKFISLMTEYLVNIDNNISYSESLSRFKILIESFNTDN